MQTYYYGNLGTIAKNEFGTWSALGTPEDEAGGISNSKDLPDAAHRALVSTGCFGANPPEPAIADETQEGDGNHNGQ